MSQKYRLVTRSDFDGLVCAMLFKELDMIDEITFVHPKDMQDGKVRITRNDITTNLPFVPGAHLVFDHHASELVRNRAFLGNYIIDPHAPSAARVVYKHYGGKARFPSITDELMEAVDKADSAQYALEDILDPQGWTLLNYLMDARTGLGRFREFRLSNYALMMELIQHCRDLPVDQVLKLPDVQERVTLYFEQTERAKAQIQRCATVHDNLVVLDLRDEEPIWATNRFMVYALYPQCNISIHVMWGRGKANTVLATGKSILDRGCTTNVGELMLEYGGGGHLAAGTCQVACEQADQVLATLVQRITSEHRQAAIAG
ncbi:MAG: exopolyphosphatase [Acidovorax sp.]|jgi:nanoRNase/pAp phosphatase (c-di-AMP/oligoRNAs hydrolase)|nr:exopolyphosphatase [Acidovorax sp.]MDR3003290.1 exopolyphosphatase [Acidovorax sp.]